MTNSALRADETIVDEIYEAALLPEGWPSVLDTLAKIGASLGGALLTIPSIERPYPAMVAPRPKWVASPPVRDLFDAFYGEGWATRCAWVVRGRERAHPGFVIDQDLFAPGEFEQTASYEFWRRYGIGWSAVLFARGPSGDRFGFAVERLYEDGPIDRATVARLDQMRPHLSRAAIISCRLGLERAHAAAQALALLGLPAAVLGSRRDLIAANDLMHARMPGQAEERAFGRFHLTDRRADALLSQALVSFQFAGDRGKANDVASIPVVAHDDAESAVAHVVPVRRNARDIFTAATSLVVLTPITSSEPPAAEVIRGLFDLTAAEARVARLVADGSTVSSIAGVSRTTEGTVRAQLKSIFAKTGTSRQAELVGLLNATALPGRRKPPTKKMPR